MIARSDDALAPPLDPAGIAAAIHEPVRLVAYDAAWPAAFSAERERLLASFGDRMQAVEHIGSTAVPGLAAKPIIDVLAGVASMADAEALCEPLLGAGYTTSRAFNAKLTDRRWFMRVTGGRRSHHLHVVVVGSPAWRDRLRFRDALRADASLARRYAALKRELAAAHANDREAYTDAKAAFVAATVAAA